VHVIIEPPGSTARLYIPCKEVGRVRVDPERVEVQRIDLDVLARTISSLLGLGTPRVIVESRLWLLDTVQLGDRTRDVFLARGAGWQDGRLLADHARLATSPCPLILVPNLLPADPIWIAGERVLMSMSEFDWFGDDSDTVQNRIAAIVAAHDRRSLAASEQAVFRKEGEIWTLSFDRKAVHVADTLGLGYIAELLRKPRVAIEAAQLAGADIKSTKLAAVPGIPLADEPAIKAVRADLVEKKAALAGLQERDWTRKGALQEDIKKLEYLGEVGTHQGKARKVAGTAQRSRTSVTNAINRAIDHISGQHPGLGRHLKESIKTGTAPVYAPANVPDWHF
jgi:hypothetical protein